MINPLQVKGIKCDNESCDFADDSVEFEEYKDWVNKLCPECGSNLLTEADMKSVTLLIKIFNNPIIKTINKVSQVFGSKLTKTKIDMNGTGKIKATILDENKSENN